MDKYKQSDCVKQATMRYYTFCIFRETSTYFFL